MTKTALFVTVLAACVGTSAFAQEQAVPEGCVAVATVHRESCMVSNYLQCGNRMEVHSFENGKLSDSHYFGPDWDLVEYQADGGRTDVTVAEGSAPEASLTTALATGESLGTREMSFSSGVLQGNAVLLESALTIGDEEVQISGETFRKGTLVRTMTVTKNGVSSQWSFEVFAAPDASFFIEGEVDIEQFGKTQKLAWTPTQIIRPGAPGFMSTARPAGCDGS